MPCGASPFFWSLSVYRDVHVGAGRGVRFGANHLFVSRDVCEQGSGESEPGVSRLRDVIQIKIQVMAKLLSWIDNAKAICMICVFILHSEAYYGFGSVSYGILFKPFYVNAFFFISGYLFFGKWLNVSMLTVEGGGI